MKTMKAKRLIVATETFAGAQLMFAAAQRSECTFDRCSQWSKWETLGAPAGLSVLILLGGALIDWLRSALPSSASGTKGE
jgi:hypothetical protein